MPRVTSLDGRVYEIDAETLEKYRIPDDVLAKLGFLPPLPSVPPPGQRAEKLPKPPQTEN
jgi:hypothetical protein